jgi:AmmeMemoRadiSam system protein B
MPIIFASICPHPPIIVPEIGQAETKKVQKTILAMKKLSHFLAEKEPEVLVVISPHGLIYPDRMNICAIKNLEGDFSQFGAPEITFRFQNDLELAEQIDQASQQKNIKTLLYENGNNSYQLDHGTLVPLYFLTQQLTRPVKILPLAYSFLDYKTHFAFGKILFSVLQSSSALVGIVASGDLSHRLLPQSYSGYTPLGKKFDTQLVSALKEKKIEKILHLDPQFAEEAGECGLRSFLILLGAINGIKYKPEILSYEGPFGVGYLVANFQIQNNT